MRKTSDSRDRIEESLRYLLPQDPNLPYDMKHVIKKVRQYTDPSTVHLYAVAFYPVVVVSTPYLRRAR